MEAGTGGGEGGGGASVLVEAKGAVREAEMAVAALADKVINLSLFIFASTFLHIVAMNVAW